MDSLSSDDENEDDFFTFQSFTYLRRKKTNSSLSNVTGSSLPEQKQTTNDMIRSSLNDDDDDDDDDSLQRRNPISFEHDTEHNPGLYDGTDDEDDDLLLLPYKSSFDTTTTTCSIPSPAIAKNTHCNNNNNNSDDDGDNSDGDDSDNLLTLPPSFKHHHLQEPTSSSRKHTKSTTTKHYHCYLLHSLSPRHPHKTYIGFTTNPYRRLRQHNGILKHGGAFRTKKSGRPWQFVCVVHGFSDKIAALQFEWAWQHFDRSRHVREGLISCERRRKRRQAAPAEGFTTPEAEEEYLVTKAKIEAKKMNRRRGVKSRFDMLRLLLVDCMPFNQYALDVHFLQQKWMDAFLDGFKEKKNDSSNTCFLPNAMTSAVLSIEEMPFWITLLREQQQQNHKKGAAGKKRLMEKDSNDNNYCAKLKDKENIQNVNLNTNTFHVNKTNTMTIHHAALSGNNTNRSNTAICFLCSQLILTDQEKPIQCEKCFIQYHVLCLADHLLDQTHDTAASNTTSGGVGRSKSTLIPTNGSCPKCNADIIWARAMAFRRQNRTFTATTTTEFSLEEIDTNVTPSDTISNNDLIESIHPPCCSTIAAADVKGISSTAIEKDYNTIILSDDGDNSDHVNNHHPSPKGNSTNICEPNTTWIGTEMEKDVEFPINFDSFDSDDDSDDYDNDDDDESKTSTAGLNTVDSSSTTSKQNDDKDDKYNDKTNLDFSFSCLDDDEQQEPKTSTTILSEKCTIGIDNDDNDDEEEKDTNAIAFSQESHWTITKALSSECIIDLCSSDSDDNHHES